jgi:ATP-dependent Clp protease ATP-binding subunit ClpA
VLHKCVSIVIQYWTWLLHATVGAVCGMFDDYSQRSIRVLFIARLQAARDGAQALGLNHILVGLIVEDQGERFSAPFVGIPLGSSHVTSAQSIAPLPHVPFYEADVAAVLLERLGAASARTDIACSPSPEADIPVAAEVEHVLREAHELKQRLHDSSVEPLHLLAAALIEESSAQVQLLQDVGISPDRVLEALRAARPG